MTTEAGYQSSEPVSHFKALLLGPGWHFSALCLWGCNINKASLKVHQLLKLSRSLPITVTMQCVQNKNMFPLYNSQQTGQRAEGEQMKAVGDTVYWDIVTSHKDPLMKILILEERNKAFPAHKQISFRKLWFFFFSATDSLLPNYQPLPKLEHLIYGVFRW